MRDCERNTMQNIRFAHRKRINTGEIEHFEQDEKPRNHHRRALGVSPTTCFRAESGKAARRSYTSSNSCRETRALWTREES